MRNLRKTKKRVIEALCILIFAIALGLFAVICIKSESSASDKTGFTYISNEGNFKVLVHNHTGVMYACSDGCYNYGILTLLVDSEGNPLIWEG